MARDYRTLKLEILAETKQFVDDMKKSETQVEGFGGKMEKFGKVAAAAFAAAAAAAVAYAGKLAIDGVKAALADEAAQARLAKALQNVTGATNQQITAVESQIEKMSLAFGVADDELRPAFQRLATATGDLAQAQDGLQLALDISAATGKSVEAVSNALGKAYEGNTGALSRLGIGLSSAEIKSLGLKGTMDQLADTFGGAATTQANTLEGQINRLRVGFDEAKESVGAALLPAVKAFIDYITNRLIPILIEAKDRALAPIKKAFEDNKEALQSLWQFTKDYLVPLFEFTLIRAIEGVGKAVAMITNIIGRVVTEIKQLVQTAVDAINFLITQYNRLPFPNINQISLGGGGGSVGNFQMSTGSSLGSSSALGGLVGALGGLSSSISGISSSVTGGSRNGGTNGTAAQRRAFSEIESNFAQLQALVAGLTGDGIPAVAGTYGAFQPMDASRVTYGGGAPIVTVNVNAPSVIDEVGFTRAVVDAMNSVERTSAGGYSALFK
jgi:hypothetical protein